MDRHTESLIYTKCPKTLGDKKESTPSSSASQPPRSDRDPTRSIRPLERDDRERAREHGAKTARASSARKNNPTASRVARSPASSRRRVVVAQPFANRPPVVPRNRASVRASKTRSHFTSHDSSNPTHTRGFGCRANDRARDAERRTPTDDATVVSHRSNAGKRSARRLHRAYLFFSAFLADALTATGAAALTDVAEMTNILSVSFVLEYADGRPDPTFVGFGRTRDRDHR